jgi:hypothetical protein
MNDHFPFLVDVYGCLTDLRVNVTSLDDLLIII